MLTSSTLARLAVLTTLLVTACGGGSDQDARALERKAASLTDLMADNDWPAVRKDFDATMEASLSESALETAWQQVTQLKGAYRSRGEPARVDKPGDFVVFDTPMDFERGPMKSRITFRPDGKVAGLFVLLPGVD